MEKMMRVVVGVGVGDRGAAHNMLNEWAGGDSYDAAPSYPSLLLVDAHGTQQGADWVLHLQDGSHPVQDWVKAQPEAMVVLCVCNPGRVRIQARPGQQVVYAVGLAHTYGGYGSYSVAVAEGGTK